MRDYLISSQMCIRDRWIWTVSPSTEGTMPKLDGRISSFSYGVWIEISRSCLLYTSALVCTHPDGHNHSGNIHVHIVINSLRIEAVPLLPYMDRPADTREGYKHRCTNAAMEYFKSEVMEMCHREGLYQIDLLNGLSLIHI